MKGRSLSGICVSKWEGTDNKVVPYGIEFQLTEGELFNILDRYYGFTDMVMDYVTKPLEGLHESEVKHITETREALKNTTVKIKLVFSMEKYK